jgi:pimeloyl-ACP methyl ester carboxylesterase
MRALLAFALLFCSLISLAAPAIAEPVDQAGWAARKQRVTLPNGVTLAYVEMGDPRGRPVLLLHGFTDSSRTWSLLAPHIASGNRLLILDQRGHGASDRPACCYSPADFAADALLFLDAMRVGRASVVGHSLGSMVAQRLAADHPDRIEAIALVASTALAPVTRGDWLWEQVNALREPIASNRAFLAQWSFGASPTPVDATFVRFADAEAQAVPLHVWRAVPRELVGLPIARHAADVRARVLILSGGRDELFPAEHHASLVAAYPRAEARVFPELGHNLIGEQPERVGPVLAAFLGR